MESAGDTGFRTGEQPVFAKHGIDESGLAGVGAADNRDAQRLRCIIGRDIVGVGIIDIIADQFIERARNRRDGNGDAIVCIVLFVLVRKDALFAHDLDNGIA